VRRIATRVAFFVWALVVSPLIMWALFETLVEIDSSERAWLWILGIPALVTFAVGTAMRRSLAETSLAALLSASVAGIGVLVAILTACSGTSDCF